MDLVFERGSPQWCWRKGSKESLPREFRCHVPSLQLTMLKVRQRHYPRNAKTSNRLRRFCPQGNVAGHHASFTCIQRYKWHYYQANIWSWFLLLLLRLLHNETACNLVTLVIDVVFSPGHQQPLVGRKVMWRTFSQSEVSSLTRSIANYLASYFRLVSHLCHPQCSFAFSRIFPNGALIVLGHFHIPWDADPKCLIFQYHK